MATTRARWGWVPTFLAVLGAAGASRGQAPPPGEDREGQIAEVRKQIEALNKKLEALTKGDAGKARAGKEGVLALGPEWLRPLSWRALGPAAMGGRVVAVSVSEADPSTFWVATAGGGLLKTVDNGITFEHQFDREATVAVGDMAVAPSDPNVVYVGTGENNPRNSVSYGDGVYRSADGGKTWANVGLRGSYQIGRIAVHPKDPNTVYVGALGRLYGPGGERGVFKTADGGKTWARVLSVDERTGVVDLRMDPADPETLIAATYERLRDLYDTGDPAKRWGPGGGLHRTTDGGKTWKKLTKGLPTVSLGRVGLDYSRKDPKTVFAVIETEKIGTGPAPKGERRAPGGAFLGVGGEGPEAAGAVIGAVVPGGPGDKAGLKVGDRVTAVGGREVKTYQDLARAVREKAPGDKVVVKVERGGKPVEVEATLGDRPPPAAGGEADEGGAGGLGMSPERPFGAVLGGQIENAQDRQGPDGFQTGGVFRSDDGGDSWARVNSLNPRPFYFSQVRVDPSDPKYVYVLGLALYRSDDGGKTFRSDGSRGVHSDHHALWVDPRDGRHLLLGGDGGFYASYDRGAHWDHLNQAAVGQFYHVALDTRTPYRAYGGMQDNGTWGGPSLRRPGAGGGFAPGGDGPVNEDWFSVLGGDGFHTAVDPTDPDLVYAASQYGGLARRNLRTGEGVPIRPRAEPGKTHRFNWNTPFLLSAHNPKIFYTAGDVVFRSLHQGDDLRPVSSGVARTPKGTATALAESPKDPDVLYVGTDDGALLVTRDGGKNWADVTKNVGLDRPCFVATLEASRAEAGRAYVAFDGHRSDTDDPLIFATEDHGKTWTSLRANLPAGSTRTLREDVTNPDLLYLGTEFAVWASADRGRSWNKLNANLPTVAVHEVAVHPTAGEVVAATHGRSLWALDVSALRQLTRETLTGKPSLLAPGPAVRWRSEPARGTTNRKFVGQNPPRGAALYAAVPSKVAKAGLKVLDFEGATVFEARVPTDPGLHKVLWPLNRPAPARGGGGFGGAFRRVRPAAPGMYKVVLTVDGHESTRALKVEADPLYPDAPPDAEAFEGVEDGDEISMENPGPPGR